METRSKRKELSEELKDFILIRRMVGRCLALHFDQDNVAGNIWLELWTRSKSTGEHVRPSWVHVRNRCIDELRRVIRKREVPLEQARGRCVRDLDEEVISRDNKELLDQIMECPLLSAEERLLVYRRYYAGASLQEISKVLGKSKTSTKRYFGNILDRLRAWVIERGLGQGKEE